MSVLILSHDEITGLLPPAECIAVMEEALSALARGEVHQPLRSVVRPPDAPGLMGLMPAYRGGERPLFALKAVNIVPANPTRGLDAHQGAVLLSDGETGVLEAVLDASAITAIRTAAVSALATRVLARDDARRVAILGAGVQARSHIAALSALGRLEQGRIWSRTLDHARAIAAEADAGFPVEVVDTAEAAVRDADVVVTVTSAREPIIAREWLADGAHVNAVGSSIPTTRELDSATIAAATLFVDRRESAENEAGDYLFPLREGVIAPDHIRGELGEVLVGAATGRSSRSELTVFKSLGLAVEDLAAAEHDVRRARELGVGTDVEL